MPDTNGATAPTDGLPENAIIQTMEGPGRPTDLTEELLEQLVRYVGVVSYVEPAAHMLGVSVRTARHWMAKGVTTEKAIRRAEKRGQPPVMTEHEARCLRFLHAVRKATATLEVQHAGNITRAAMGRPGETRTTERVLPDGTLERTVVVTEGRAPDWRASLAFLERTQFKRWGRKTAHLHENGQPGQGQGAEQPIQGSGHLTLAAVREILLEDHGTPLALPAGPAGAPPSAEDAA
jgi:hypothetical protein